MKREAWLVCKGVRNNSIFDEESNRDGLSDKWIALRKYLAQHSIDLVTPDVAQVSSPLFELQLNVQAKRKRKWPAYVILAEAPPVYPPNGDVRCLSEFRHVFSWDSDRVCQNGWTRIALAHRLSDHGVDGFSSRPMFCTMIAANKALPQFSIWDLYSERVGLILWFERFAPEDFALFGPGWDLDPRQPGMWGSVKHRLTKALGLRRRRRPFPSWQGTVTTKREVLTRSKFTIAYENVRELPGYITEKIFDAFSAGCVPIYWGASNVAEYIPADCFIDRRQFQSNDDLYRYLKQMDVGRYRQYQWAIADFVMSEQADAFRVDVFARTIAEAVLSDLGDRDVEVARIGGQGKHGPRLWGIER